MKKLWKNSEYRRKQSKNNKISALMAWRNPEIRKRITSAIKKGCQSLEFKRKIGASNRKRIVSEETRKKMRQSHPDQRGKKGSNWQGGKSFEPYSINWTNTLKRSIRERDHYTCQMCFEQQCDLTFAIHHINGNKKNCNPKNLITLCPSCHNKIHGIKRKRGLNASK